MGFIFVVPSLIGLFVFFLYPMINSFIISLSDVVIDQNKGLLATMKGFGNYNDALYVNTEFLPKLTSSLMDMLTSVPVIVLFSFFAATIINQKFKGRTIARVIFLLPIVLSSSAIMTFDTWDALQSGMRSGGFKNIDTAANALANFRMADVIRSFSGLPDSVIATLAGYVDGIYQIVRMSGIQILIMFAGLQSISPSLFEAADVEGASSWEKYWLITFPMISPVLLLATVYTIIDSFTAYNNWVVVLIKDTMFASQKFGLGSAMAFIYFAIVSVIVALVMFIGNKAVFYYDK